MTHLWSSASVVNLLTTGFEFTHSHWLYYREHPDYVASEELPLSWSIPASQSNANIPLFPQNITLFHKCNENLFSDIVSDKVQWGIVTSRGGIPRADLPLPSFPLLKWRTPRCFPWACLDTPDHLLLYFQFFSRFVLDSLGYVGAHVKRVGFGQLEVRHSATERKECLIIS